MNSDAVKLFESLQKLKVTEDDVVDFIVGHVQKK